MKYKYKAIIKRPDEEYGHMTFISNTLENLQRTVGGYIETIPVTSKDVILCDEEGKLKLKPTNISLGNDFIVGTIVVLGVDGDEFTDVHMTFKEWKEFIDQERQLENGGKHGV